MRFSLKSLALTSGLLWSGALLFAGAINLRHRSYARHYLRLMSSVYPGYRASRTPKDVLVGTAYSFLDGAIGGLVFGWLYNAIAAAEAQTAKPGGDLRVA